MSLLIPGCVVGTALTGFAAIAWGRAAGLFLCAVWSASLVYFVVPPAYSFQISQPADLEILGAYGIVSVAVAHRLPRTYGRRARRSPDGGASPYEVEFHLTPSGWVRGSEWFVGILQADVKAPSGRLLTVVKRVYQRPGDTAATVTLSETWRDAGAQDDELTRLRALHPLLHAPTDAENRQAPVLRKPMGRVRASLSRLFGWDDEPYEGE